MGRLESLDPSGFDLSPEKPIGGVAAMHGPAQVWSIVVIVALGFFVLLLLTVVVSLVLR